MKKEIFVPLADTPVTLISGITFARVPFFFPFWNYKDLKLDIILPFKRIESERNPLLVWICGGAWMTMERTAHLPWLMNFARRGYIVASVEYRLSNSAHFPAQLEDVKKAVRYLRAHADELGIDPGKVIVGGESAGAYLAAMAGAANRRKEFNKGEYLEQSSEVQAVIDYYGPSGFTLPTQNTRQMEEEEKPDFLKGPSPADMLLGFNASEEPVKADTAGVLHYIGQSAPPYFIAHGTDDVIVSPANSEALYNALERNKVPAELYMIRGAGHADPRFYQTEMSDRIMEFLDKYLIHNIKEE